MTQDDADRQPCDPAIVTRADLLDELGPDAASKLARYAYRTGPDGQALWTSDEIDRLTAGGCLS